MKMKHTSEYLRFHFRTLYMKKNRRLYAEAEL